MAKFTKAVLKVGETFRSPDRDVPITRERLQHFADQHRRLLAAGYDVPSRWEHADDTRDMLPLSTEEFNKKLDGRHAVGRLVDFRLTDGGTQAELLLDVSDSRAVEQCEANRVKVSPVIADWWRDGHGNEYSDLITHVDLVERPVDYSQGPFQRADEAPSMVACSTEFRTLSAKVVRMALEDDGMDTEMEAESTDTAPPPVEDSMPNPDMPPVPPTVDPKQEALIAGFATLGVVVPSDWSLTADGATDILLAAINSAIATKQKADADAAASTTKQPEEEPITVASPGYASMSTEKNPLFLLLKKQKQESLAKDIDRALEEGRITPHESQECKASMATIRMSLDNAGNWQATDVDKFLKSRSAEAFKGLFHDVSRLAAEPAKHHKAGMHSATDEEAAKAAEEQLKRTGYVK